MTVREFFDWAKERDALDCNVVINYAADERFCYCENLKDVYYDVSGGEVYIRLYDHFGVKVGSLEKSNN